MCWHSTAGAAYYRNCLTLLTLGLQNLQAKRLSLYLFAVTVNGGYFRTDLYARYIKDAAVSNPSDAFILGILYVQNWRGWLHASQIRSACLGPWTHFQLHCSIKANIWRHNHNTQCRYDTNMAMLLFSVLSFSPSCPRLTNAKRQVDDNIGRFIICRNIQWHPRRKFSNCLVCTQ